MEEYKNVMEEHNEGTVVPLNTEAQMKEEYEKLQMEHLAAMEANDEGKAKEIEEKINHISEQLGWDEEKLAA